MLRFVSLSLITITSATVCDLFDAANTPCVAAHSTTRSLYKSYQGKLYRVHRTSDNTTLDIQTSNGIADAASQDTFCKTTSCTIIQIYDQSSQANHLSIAPAGGNVPHADLGVVADKAPTTLNGQKVYAAYFEGDMGYRLDKTKGVAINDEPETIYMVTSGRHYNGGCCFDYGNAETNNDDTGAGSMESVYWGNSSGWGSGSGKGPWVMVDLEDGLWAGNKRVGPGYTINADFVVAMAKGDSGNHFALKGGDATSDTLKVLYDGKRPKGYHPMKKQGAIILGIGGDNSNRAVGTFYEGVMTQGYTSDATDNAVQKNIKAAGYGI